MNMPRFLKKIDQLSWVQGELDETSWQAACVAARIGIPDDLAFTEIAARIETAGGVLVVDKLWSQISRAKKTPAITQHSSRPRNLRVPKAFEPGALDALLAGSWQGDAIAELLLRSPVCPSYLSSGEVLSYLYRPGESVMVLLHQKIRRGSLWEYDAPDSVELPIRGGQGVFFLINPVDGQCHRTPDGKTSYRSEHATTSFRYLLIESDKVDEKRWADLLLKLPVPISAIYKSGGKSLHALVEINAASKADWDTMVRPFKVPLARLGADPAAMTAVRLSRLPQAWRGDRQQELLFLNAQPKPAPILSMEIRPLWRDWISYAWLKIRQNDLTLDDVKNFHQNIAGNEHEPGVREILRFMEGQPT